MTRWLSRLLRAAALAVAVTLLAPAAPAAAVETYPRPADGVYDLQGRGFGHGRGMSQWGAQAIALSGRSYTSILGYYYRGTTISATAGASRIRVWLSRDDERDTTIYAESGLRLNYGRSSTPLPTTRNGFAVTFYRAYRTSTGSTRVDGRSAGAWFPVTIGGRRDFAATLVFTDDDRLIRLLMPDSTSRTYRGAMLAVQNGTTGMLSVAAMTMEEYLRSVVPSEVFPTWRPAALQAQSIAARTFASRRAAGRVGASYDVCDTVQCQDFNGTGLYSSTGSLVRVFEQSSTTSAVLTTAGRVLLYPDSQGVLRLIDAQFSASNGRWTTGVTGFGYLTYRKDLYDDGGDANGDGVQDNPNRLWTATLPASAVEAAYPAIGTLVRLEIDRISPTDRTSRITRLNVVGTTGSVLFDTSNELDSFRARVDIDPSATVTRRLKSTVFWPIG